MGSCQSLKYSPQVDFEISIDQKNTSSQVSQTLKLKSLDDTIADERESKKTPAPPFIQSKEINPPLEVFRNNRFLKDLEDEVRRRIKEIQMEEEMQSKQEQKSIDPCFSFQNSIIRAETIVSNPYQPKQASQFAPKKDGDTVSNKSQISKNNRDNTSPKGVSPKIGTSKDQEVLKQQAIRRIQTLKEDLKSNNASNGSSNSRKKAQLDAFEKMFSEFYSHEKSSSRSLRSIKSILKKKRSTSSVNLSNSKQSIKSTHTVLKNKRVRFTNDTNFSFERKSVTQPKRKRHFWDF